MPRPDRTPAPDERAAGAQRLDSLGLPAAAKGWVPQAPDPQPGPAAAMPSVSPPAVPGPTELARDWAKDRAPAWSHAALDRATAGSVLTCAAAVVAALIAAVMLLHHHGSGDEPTSYQAASGVGSGSSSYSQPVSSDPPAAGSSIVVDVGGRVRKPGLVTLPEGARVADAIAAAGGPLRHRELAVTNLAARVTDGQLLLVGVTPPSEGPASGGTSASVPSSAAPIDLNSATLEELETLPGVGPVTGQKILDWRTAHSGFTSVEQLQQVSGIGPATYAELSPLVTP